MKSKGKMAKPVEQKQRDHFELELTDLPNKEKISIQVLYDDVKDPVLYDVGETSDGSLTYVFPVIGKEGQVRVFAGDKLLGKRAIG